MTTDATSEPLGDAVLVGGQVVAWFTKFDDSAEEWCTCNHFGKWMTWRATAPEIIPLTQQELDAAERRGKDMAARLKLE